ncbi:MAG: NAD(P)H-hydrate dehydratase [Selenomonadaceae bacterium]|nr:NAD(P)H-hydrate dehydratase [Selenomonadaceae bacterium]
MKVALAKQMHEIDDTVIKDFGLPELSLMESAGHRVAQFVEKILGGVEKKSLCILAGSGNNGGDALVAARYLANRGAKLKIFLTGNKDHRTDSLNVQIAIMRAMGAEIQQLDNDRAWERLQVNLRFADAILDGILGTGFTGELRPNALKLIRIANATNKPIISIDIPSGVEADTGIVGDTAIKAAGTVALGLPKVAHYLCPGASYVGELFVDDIGIPQKLLNENIHQTLLDSELAVTLLPARNPDVHKGTCGKILVIAGSRGMTGAACLASMSALKIGAGIVTLAAPESLHDLYEVKLTEVMTTPLAESKSGIIGGDGALATLLNVAEKFDGVLIGSGLGRDAITLDLVRNFVANVDKPLVMDADAIFAFKDLADELKNCKQVPILTPHFGELATLLNISVTDLRKNLIEIVRQAAQDFRAIIVAKSECTVIAYPNGEIFISPLGNSAMATAGSGDVLAGTIAGLMKLTPFAPLAGVYLHGTAGDIAAEKKSEGLIASDIMENLPAAILKLRELQSRV